MGEKILPLSFLIFRTKKMFDIVEFVKQQERFFCEALTE
ncbi:hypothetical protein SB521682_0798 [Shigella boydii 5216-82]|nr:hypothetical protein SB521682_0798 [Shigella boydii 5216-82]